MPKELTRDSASDAFRFWGFVSELKTADESDLEGFFPGEGVVNKYKRLLTADIIKPVADGIRSGVSDPSPEALIRVERRLENARAALLDMEAVGRTLEWLSTERDGQECIAGITAVYMTDPEVPLDRFIIRDRTVAFSDETNISYNTALRRLKKARCKWAEERGLKIFESSKLF